MRTPLMGVGVAVALTIGSSAVLCHATASALPSDDRAIVHLLNRIGFGPRPGDVARVRAIGVERYLDQQLRPERIADPAIDAHLADLTTLRMSGEEIRTGFEQPLI